MTKSILVLDDDKSFRELLVRILKPLGFPVVEARSVKDALNIVSSTELALAIVDFRLPETDGMTFITRLREAGKEMPVVLVSGTWCDPKTFNWMRNILRVSLVLQKPIQPQLFLQQIDVLLPAQRPQQIDEDAELSYQDLLAAAAGMEDELSAEEMRQIDELDPERRAHVLEMRMKVEAEKAIREAQRDLSSNVPPMWEQLSKAVRTFQQDLSNQLLRDDANILAHTLKGTAGSLGLMKTSAAAGKIEDYTRMLDASDPLGNEILWLEIFRALADGETELASLVGEKIVAAEPVNVGRVLLLSTEQRVNKNVHDLTPAVDAQFTFTETPVDAARKAASTRFDAAVLDVSRFTKNDSFSLARALRMTEMNDGLPMAFVAEQEDAVPDVERLFYGASATLTAPYSQADFEEMLRQLSSVNQSKQARILTVDDDPVLTVFIERILSSHGMAVSTLNEPINILDTLEKNRPDLVLLDVIMPGLSGYDICRMLRASEKWKDIPIIFLTSKSDAQGRSAAFQAGANDFLAKPIISEELLLRTKLQLQQAKAERERGGADEITGLLSEQKFADRAAQIIAENQECGQSATLCLIDIDNIAQYEEFGMFSSINIIATLGRLLQSRFPAETLRGRWTECGFALLFANETAKTVSGATALFAEEFEQITFTGEGGTSYSATIKFAVASAPADAMNVSQLMPIAVERLMSPTLL